MTDFRGIFEDPIGTCRLNVSRLHAFFTSQVSYWAGKLPELLADGGSSMWKIGFAGALQFVTAAHLFCQFAEIRPISNLRDAQDSVSRPVIRTSANLVLVPVHVTNRAGATITGLQANSFTVLEDKASQNIVSFGSEDMPCSVGIVLDLSGSMSSKMNLAADALRSFLETANPEDEAFLLAVSSKPQNLSGFTTDFGLLQSRLVATQAGGATALIDTIYTGLSRLRGARYAHKALFVISDGMDNHSRYSQPELMRVAEESEAQIYTVSIANWTGFKKPIELTEERNGQFFLQALADRTGGLNRVVRSFDEAQDAAVKLSRAIREQYLIGYRPSGEDPSGKWRAIQVKINLPKAQVSARTGYYSR